MNNNLLNMYSSLQQIKLTGANILSVIRSDPEFIDLYDGIVWNICQSCFSAAIILMDYFDDEKSGLYTEEIALDLKYELQKEKWQKWLNDLHAYDDKLSLNKIDDITEAIAQLDSWYKNGLIDDIPADDPELLLRAWNDFVSEANK